MGERRLDLPAAGRVLASRARALGTAHARRWTLIVWLVAAAACIGALAFSYMKLVEKGFIRYNKWDRRVRGTLRRGDAAPDLQLARYDGRLVRLSALWADKPLVLIFGSCT